MIISPAALAEVRRPTSARHPVGAGPVHASSSWMPRLKLDRGDATRTTGSRACPTSTASSSGRSPTPRRRYASIAERRRRHDLRRLQPGARARPGQPEPAASTTARATPASSSTSTSPRPPFDDRSMREAIIRAIDLKALSASQYNNQHRPGRQPVRRRTARTTRRPRPTRGRRSTRRRPSSSSTTTGPRAGTRTSRSRPPQPGCRSPSSSRRRWRRSASRSTCSSTTWRSSPRRCVQSGDFQLTHLRSSPFDNPYPGVRAAAAHRRQRQLRQVLQPAGRPWLLDAAEPPPTTPQRTKDYQQVELQVEQGPRRVPGFSRSYLSTITKPDVKGIDRYISRDMFYATTWLDR